jgi:hypothetical protein
MSPDGMTVDRKATDHVELPPNTQEKIRTGYENTDMVPQGMNTTPIDASSVTPGTQGSYSVSEPDKNRGLVITTSETKDLSPQQETDMFNSIIKANEGIDEKKPK